MYNHVTAKEQIARLNGKSSVEFKQANFFLNGRLPFIVCSSTDENVLVLVVYGAPL